MFNVDQQIQQWRRDLSNAEVCRDSDLDELESHLRDEIENLEDRGLSTEEAFIVASRRLGNRGSLTREFAKVNDQWQYAPDPDLPIDPKRVQDLLLRLKDLTSERFVAYKVTDPAAYGLDEPEHSVTVKLADGVEQRLIVSAGVCEADPAKRRYATVVGTGEVFLVSGDTIKRFEIELDEYEAP